MNRAAKSRKGKGSQGQNRKQSDNFLLKNSKKEGVITLISGLQYKIIEKGTGPHPDLKSTLTVHHRISLINGTPIDDTYQKNTPEIYNLAEAIDGLKEGIPLMQTGARFTFYIPPHLAWGQRGAGTKIGPNATLIYDVRLLEHF